MEVGCCRFARCCFVHFSVIMAIMAVLRWQDVAFPIKVGVVFLVESLRCKAAPVLKTCLLELLARRTCGSLRRPGVVTVHSQE